MPSWRRNRGGERRAGEPRIEPDRNGREDGAVGSRRVAPWTAVVALASTGFVYAQDAGSGFSGYVSLSSGYWRYGLAQTDGPSLQLAVDYQHYTGFFAYARAMNVAYPQNLPYQERDVETSAYIGYRDRGERWSWTVSGGRYWYPGTDGYDYDEWSASVGFRDRVFYTASYSDEFYARGSSALNQELAFAFPLRQNVEIGGAVGYFDVSGGPAITHWNIGASKLVGPLAIDLRYYDGNYAVRGYLGDPEADHYVLSFSYGLNRNSLRVRR
jgi:uncharacterized protein (TIGR02001 family)